MPKINEYVQQPIRGTKLLVQLSSSGKYFVWTSTNQIIFPSILRMRLRRHNMPDKRFEQRMRRMSHSLERRCPLMIDHFAWYHIVSHRYWYHWAFRTIFTTLRALLKSGLCATQLCIRSDTASYVFDLAIPKKKAKKE